MFFTAVPGCAAAGWASYSGMTYAEATAITDRIICKRVCVCLLLMYGSMPAGL
jgi:hypothetical protein